MTTNQPFLDFYCCPANAAKFVLDGSLGREPEFFRFGDTRCYGRCAAGYSSPKSELQDTASLLQTGPSGVVLPFYLTDIIDNLRLARYMPASNGCAMRRVVRGGYHFIRPALGVSTRRHLQNYSCADATTCGFRIRQLIQPSSVSSKS